MFTSRAARPAAEPAVCCASGCARRCEADALARRMLDQLLRQGWRLA